MPAANSSGSAMIAYHGSPLAAPVPASTSSATSVAVSNPSPNRTPTETSGWAVTVLVSRPGCGS